MRNTLRLLGISVCLFLVALTVGAQTPIPIQFSTDGGNTYNQSIEAVRIGEYLWLNKDFKRAGDSSPATQEQIDRILMWYQMFQHHAGNSTTNDSFWNYTTLEEFNNYLGTYFNRNDIGAFETAAFYAKEDANPSAVKWKLPNAADVHQLIAMCGNGTLNEVRKYLSFDHSDPMAPSFVKNIEPMPGRLNGYWWYNPAVIMGYNGLDNTNITEFEKNANNNKFGFNLIANGSSRYHAPGVLWTVDHSNNDAPISYTTEENDFNGLFQVGSICAGLTASLSLNDVIEMKYGASFEKRPIRFCRPLTDAELGYKLYINQDIASYTVPTGDVFESARFRSGDENLLAKVRAGEVKIEDIQIIKKNIGESVPAGFEELPRGYIRGFYVQYILNKPANEQKTIEDIFTIALHDKKIWTDPYRIDRPASSIETKNLEITYAGSTTSYDVVRIGEYLWTNRNIVTPTLSSFSEDQVVSILSKNGVSRADYPIDPQTFEANFGALLSNWWSFQSVSSAIEDGVSIQGWDMPSPVAYDQLFGMCGRNGHGDVKAYLGAKVGDNPAAMDVDGTPIGDWFKGNMNVYGFNLMPTGQITQGSGQFDNFFGVTHLRAKADNGSNYGTIVWPENVTEKNWYVFPGADMSYIPSRFCRRLTDAELGYKIFINNNDLDKLGGYNHILDYLGAYDELDIKVIYDPNAIAPNGYSEMPNGRMRGFFVQFNLANHEPNAQQLDEVYGYYRIMSAPYDLALSVNSSNISGMNFEDKDGQHWRIEKVGNDFKISNNALAVLSYNGSDLIVEANNSSDNQLWNIYIEGNDMYRISPKNSPTKALDITKGDVTSSLSVNVYEKKSSQKWKLPHSVLYLVGDATDGGWDLSQMERIEFNKSTEDIFVWKGHLKAGTFKINSLKDSFSEGLYAASNDLLVYAGNTYDIALSYPEVSNRLFKLAKEGDYSITVDLNKRTINIINIHCPDCKDLVSLVYSQDNLATQIPYEGVRIGEYYWMNSNFYNPENSSPTKVQLEKVLQKQGLNPSDYDVNMEDFKRYYGEYYSRGALEYMYYSGNLYEGDDKNLTGWKLPSVSDFEQLFAMCGDGSNNDIRKYLGCKEGDNPIAYSFPGMQWFANNINEYGFNMTPGGARAHASDDFGYGLGYLSYGDFYELFNMSRFVADGAKTITIKDGHARVTDKLWHLLNMRWCRKLTETELGYKLYINVQDYNESKEFLEGLNSSTVDIVKLDSDGKQRLSAPMGYYELAEGYLRGFYIQNSFDNFSSSRSISYASQMSVSDMVDRTKELKGARTTTGIATDGANGLYLLTKNNQLVVIQSTNQDVVKDIKIFTTDGRLVYSVQSSDQDIQISIDGYSSGTYVISVKTKENSLIEKFTKK